jgi:hypothetical protein
MASLSLVGADIVLYINNAPYKITQSVMLDIDYGEDGIFGIDSPWAQEIAGTRALVKGSVKGLRVKNSGGLQASNMRPLFTDLAASPYVSIRIQDRSTGEDIALITNAKVSKETHTAAIKGVYKLDFDFVGQMVLMSLDRSY